jgi:TatD DNase family protein
MKGLEEISVSEPKYPFPVLEEDASLVDTHCHLDMDEYSTDLGDVLHRARQQKVDRIITIGIDLESSKTAIALARKHPGISASVGVHPHNLLTSGDGGYEELLPLIEQNRDVVVGFGEIGLDYVKNYHPHELQRQHFRIQLDMARKTGLPLIIHDREAHDDVLRILDESGPLPAGGVMHCFSGDYPLACTLIDRGFHISIPGVVTFKNATSLQEVARKIPLSSLLLETDGPFLAPHPWRGKRNEPAYVTFTAAHIAELRGISISSLARATSYNASALFHLSTSRLLIAS